MTKVERFQDNEIPYELLASFGLSQEMVDDLHRRYWSSCSLGNELHFCLFAM